MNRRRDKIEAAPPDILLLDYKLPGLSGLDELDLYALHRHRQVVSRVLDAYEACEFHLVYHQLVQYAAADLSSFYLDVLKDRLYTSAPGSRLRRSAQTVLHEILVAVVKLMAPVLSFTADEVWRYVPMRDRPASVHLAESPDEARFLISGDGPWREFLDRRVGPVPFAPPGSSPVIMSGRRFARAAYTAAV